MAYLILEDDQLKRPDTGVYFDFNPENENERSTVTNILASRRQDNGQNKTVTLLSASGEETENGLGRLLTTVMELFRREPDYMQRKARNRFSKRCKNPQKCCRSNRSTNDHSVV